MDQLKRIGLAIVFHTLEPYNGYRFEIQSKIRFLGCHSGQGGADAA